METEEENSRSWNPEDVAKVKVHLPANSERDSFKVISFLDLVSRSLNNFPKSDFQSILGKNVL